MGKIKRLLVVIAALLLISIPLTAYAASGDTTVYRTKTGKCYHSAGCSSLSKSSIEISLQDAVSKGLTPCSKCKPPKLDDELTTQTKSTNTKANAVTKSSAKSTEQAAQSDCMVWLSATGSKYHSVNDCGNMNPLKATQVTESEAISKGKTKCSKCWK